MGEKGTGITFVVMPVEMLQNKKLSSSEKILYCYLNLFKNGICFQSNEGIRKNTGIDVRSIQRGLKKLQELGYVYVEFVNNNSAMRRIYTVLDNPNKLAYLSRKGMFKLNKDEAPKREKPKPVKREPQMGDRPKRKDYASSDGWAKAFYKWNKTHSKTESVV